MVAAVVVVEPVEAVAAAAAAYEEMVWDTFVAVAAAAVVDILEEVDSSYVEAGNDEGNVIVAGSEPDGVEEKSNDVGGCCNGEETEHAVEEIDGDGSVVVVVAAAEVGAGQLMAVVHIVDFADDVADEILVADDELASVEVRLQKGQLDSPVVANVVETSEHAAVVGIDIVAAAAVEGGED